MDVGEAIHRMNAPLSMRAIAQEVRARGLRWFLRAVLNRLRKKLRSALVRLFTRTYKLDKDTLYAYYDLDVDPITFDVAWFCVGAEFERRARGLTKIEFIIVPGRRDGMREEPRDYEEAVDRDNRIWRLHNVVVPVMLSMRPTGRVYYAADLKLIRSYQNKPDNVYPAHYDYYNPTAFDADEYLQATRTLDENGLESFFSAGPAGRRYIERWRDGVRARKRLLVVTLRQYAYMTERNSDIGAWVAWARSLDKDKYSVVFIPDTDTAFDPLVEQIEREFLVMREAAYNVPLRTALYESAYLNMSTMTGPASMFMLNRNCRYIVFKIIVPSAPMSTEERLRSYGFVPGCTPKFATPFQKWVWEPDSVQVLTREFALFETLAESGAISDVPLISHDESRAIQK